MVERDCEKEIFPYCVEHGIGVVPIPGSKNQERILENLGAWNVELTDTEFAELEQALDACTVYGHRGHVESEQTSFGKNWAKK